MNNGQTTKLEFKSLPEPIKTWLASGQATNFVYEINRGLGAQGENRRVIPTLILRLCVGDLAAGNFAKELSEKLNLDAAKTQSVLQDIEQKILRPVGIKIIQAAPAPVSAAPASPPTIPPLRVPSPPPVMKVPINVPKQSPIAERVENRDTNIQIHTNNTNE